MTSSAKGSQTVGMTVGFAAVDSLARESSAAGSDLLGTITCSLSQEGPKVQLNEIQSSQPAPPVFGPLSLDAARESINA